MRRWTFFYPVSNVLRTCRFVWAWMALRSRNASLSWRSSLNPESTCHGPRPGPTLAYWVRAGSLRTTEPRARGKTRGRKRKKCRRVKTTHLYTFIYTYTYIYVYTNRHLRSEQLFWRENENSTPRRETTRAPPRPPPAKSGEASKARHDEQTAQRTVDLISSYQ